ncbi:hypothetical protein TRFO_04458 [Tritrichomonas foetus]|uniref:Uncharacterized protein n=1 Tax=Tritrichomonas foetus TaxID=1144522 RepID=A0A1J4KFV1_9EUKA|nr:hypothetical protein TRFO_04458 [Tritrichomonas foetus]|eukprot:OHT09906.1 hypothetical protein TRFO_04458 [Tritrichomonas foetus]
MLFLLLFLIKSDDFDIFIEDCNFENNNGDGSAVKITAPGSVLILYTIFRNNSFLQSTVDLGPSVRGEVKQTSFQNNTGIDLKSVEKLDFDNICLSKPQGGGGIIQGGQEVELDSDYYNCDYMTMRPTAQFTVDNVPIPKRRSIVKFGFFTFLLLEASDSIH